MEDRGIDIAIGGFFLLLALWLIGSSLVGSIPYSGGLAGLIVGTLGFYLIGHALTNNS